MVRRTRHGFALSAIFCGIFTAATAQAAPLNYLGEKPGSESTAPGGSKFQPFSLLNFPGLGDEVISELIAGNKAGKSVGVPFNPSQGGAQWWEVSGVFTINFNNPGFAFGFFGNGPGSYDPAPGSFIQPLVEFVDDGGETTPQQLVPEPTLLALLGVGVLGAAAQRRRRQAAA